MENIKLRTHVGPDGEVNLRIPVGPPERDVELEVTIRDVPGARDSLGWPTGYFEQTFGSFRDRPLVRLEQGELEERSAFP